MSQSPSEAFDVEFTTGTRQRTEMHTAPSEQETQVEKIKELLVIMALYSDTLGLALLDSYNDRSQRSIEWRPSPLLLTADENAYKKRAAHILSLLDLLHLIRMNPVYRSMQNDIFSVNPITGHVDDFSPLDYLRLSVHSDNLPEDEPESDRSRSDETGYESTSHVPPYAETAALQDLSDVRVAPPNPHPTGVFNNMGRMSRPASIFMFGLGYCSLPMHTSSPEAAESPSYRRELLMSLVRACVIMEPLHPPTFGATSFSPTLPHPEMQVVDHSYNHQISSINNPVSGLASSVLFDDPSSPFISFSRGVVPPSEATERPAALEEQAESSVAPSESLTSTGVSALLGRVWEDRTDRAEAPAPAVPQPRLVNNQPVYDYQYEAPTII